ncbi:hypothetical protein PanWU01x14_351580 [Parasponia andersonii]|uniref:Uncharacterized protein n=1 Tax=Parasponia andersonii TaxID=3476 RepID=A0A2P5AAL7_PARAD|nr:hypothetical protein PanWU01x14_351580 [Parasponia andersonii]
MESKFRRVIITQHHKVHLFPDAEPRFLYIFDLSFSYKLMKS